MRQTLTLCALALLAPCAAFASGSGASADRLDAAVDRLYPSLVECRRWFHQHPELSNREEQTAAEIARRLREIGYEPRAGVAHHGVVAVLEGDGQGPWWPGGRTSTRCPSTKR